MQQLARQSRSRPSVAFRARMLLSCANGLSNAALARKLRTTDFTVGFWRNRFIAEGVAGLGDQPRPGAPRQIGDEEIEGVVRLTLEKTPQGATHWSTRRWAARTGFRQSSISRIWRGFGLKPHRSESFQLSADPLLIDQVRDMVGLYLNPPEHAMVLAVDEKSPIQALSRSPPLLPLRVGQLQRRTHDYQRHGVTSLFAALNVARGRGLGKCYPRHRAVEFLDFLKRIDAVVAAELELHLVRDNSGTHKAARVRQWWLLVHAQHHRVLGRVQVQSPPHPQLWRQTPGRWRCTSSAAVAVDFVLAQHAPDLIIANLGQGARQQRPRPLAVSRRGRLIQLGQDALLRIAAIAGRLARPRPVRQPRQTMYEKALPPLRDPRRPGMQPPGNGASPQPIAG